MLSLLSEGVRGVLLDQFKSVSATNGEELSSAFYRMPLRELFDKIPIAAPSLDMVDCTRKLYSYIAGSVLKNHHLLSKWHDCDSESSEDLCKEFYISRKAVWEEVELLVAFFIKSSAVAYPFIKQDAFRHIVALTSIFMSAGEAYCGDASLKLHAHMRQKAASFCAAFHKESCDILESFLTRAPRKRLSFDLTSMGGSEGIVERSIATPKHTRALLVFDFNATSDPFLDFEAVPSVRSRAGSEPEDYNDAGEDPGDSVDIVLTTTIVNCLIKYSGKYISLMESIPPLSVCAFESLQSFFDVYIHRVLTTFVPKRELGQLFPENGIVSKTSAARYQRLRNYILARCIIPPPRLKAKASSSTIVAPPPPPKTAPPPLITELGPSQKRTFPFPVKRNPGRSLNFLDRSTYYELAPRCVAAESLKACAFIMQSMRSRLEGALPPIEREETAARLFENIGPVSDQLRRLIMRAAARDMMVGLLSEIPAPEAPAGMVKSVVQLINFVRWDQMKSLQTDHSSYVGMILLWMRKVWTSLMRHPCEGINYPRESINTIFDVVVELLYRDLLEAYSGIKKFTTNGLALMTLDLVTLRKGIAEFYSPGQSGEAAQAYQILDGYVKAYYFTAEEDLLAWIQAHSTDYAADHFKRLVDHGIGRTMKRRKLKEFHEKVKAVILK